MKLAIMQPYFFPYIGYFQCIAAVDKYILYENLDYITEGWMHRNRILIKNKAASYINARTIGRSSNKKISEIELDTNFIWKKKLINSIRLNYSGAKYFEESFALIEQLIQQEHKYLFEYNTAIIKGICNFLNIKTTIISDNKNYLPFEDKLNAIDYNDYSMFTALLKTKPIKKVARVLEMCRMEQADTFVNAIGGKDLYDKKEFEQYDIDLFFIQTGDIAYEQFNRDFFPHLSIIDVLMHNGREQTKELLNNYKLV